jgi:hypothetical protein
MKTEMIISIITIVALCVMTSLLISYVIPQPYAMITNLVVGGFIGSNFRRIYNKISAIVKEDIKE